MFKSVSPKVDFVEIEHQLLDWWYSSGLVQKYLHKNDASSKRFSFLDGPITANNPMGVHHAWGRTYKDLWQRYKNMKGYKQRFQNGFDCQGLWVEVEVEKELGFKSKKDIESYGIDKFIEKCKERVKKYSEMQTAQSKRLGYFMDWDNSYYTLSDENNYMIWYFLKKCNEKGWLYKGIDSVPWCPRCGTAISQHEMLTEDYKELTHETVFFKVKLQDFDNTYLMIWTTTPWTIPANVAVAVNPTFLYRMFKSDKTGEKVIVLHPEQNPDPQFGEKILKDLEKAGFNLKGERDFKGKELEGLKYIAPFDGLERVEKARKENQEKFHSVVMAEDLVVATKGTGLLHIATGAGTEDFRLGKKLGLPVIEVIDEEATYISELGEFSGKNAKWHPEIIINYLRSKENGRFLFMTEAITHRYPACWRCKTELVWRVVGEWYIKMDELRYKIMEIVKKITWLPGFGLDRELDWLKNMEDWLISKKRYWGLTLPIWKCDKCDSFEVIGSKEELKKKAVSGWDKFEGHTPHRPFVDEVKIACSKCGQPCSRIKDVGNPWLDAGIVAYSTFIDPDTKKLSYTNDKKYWKEWFPVDFITESFPGQFKNWFYSLLAMSTVLENKEPFKTVLGFATLFGEDGRPMHKSWGNSVEFNEGADKIGVDVMRWMYVTHDSKENLLFGYKIADETRRKFHLMLWNIYVFFVTYANIDNWEFKSEGFVPEKVLDKWIVSKLEKLSNEVSSSLDRYDVYTASMLIQKFVEDLSTWYVRRIRDRVGPSAKNNEDKKKCHDTLYYTLVTLCKILAPFNPFISEEIYKNLTDKESVHLENWPEAKKELIDEALEKEMELGRQICEIGHAARKESNLKVRQPLSSVTYSYHTKISKDIEEIIAQELNVKTVNYQEKKTDTPNVSLDTKLTPKLIDEGIARNIVREIQSLRKELGCRVDELVEVELPSWPKSYEDYIKQETLASTLKSGEKTNIIRQNV